VRLVLEAGDHRADATGGEGRRTNEAHLMDLSFGSIAQFFKDRASDLRRIVSRTKGDVELGDVESEAWLAAADIERKRGYPFDFADPNDQETLLGRLYNRLVKYAEQHFRHAVKLDVDWDKEESTAFGAVLARLLAAPVSSDPAARLQQEQDSADVGEAVTRSYSEASAYVLLLMRFEWEALELAMHLQIALATLRLRLRRASAKVNVQPSLFDGVEKIDRHFRPTIGAPKLQGETAQLAGHQWEWSF
jgi:hypothetical protein